MYKQFIKVLNKLHKVISDYSPKTGQFQYIIWKKIHNSNTSNLKFIETARILTWKDINDSPKFHEIWWKPYGVTDRHVDDKRTETDGQGYIIIRPINSRIKTLRFVIQDPFKEISFVHLWQVVRNKLIKSAYASSFPCCF